MKKKAIGTKMMTSRSRETKRFQPELWARARLRERKCSHQMFGWFADEQKGPRKGGC